MTKQDDTWQPIETAPKDGTTILLKGSNWIRTGWWASRINAWSVDTAVSSLQKRYNVAAAEVDRLSKRVEQAEAEALSMPTHWMPLPSPPQTKDQP